MIRYATAAALSVLLVGCIAEENADSAEEQYLAQAVDSPEDCDTTHKVVICHLPPGNPDNARLLCVDEHAIPAHVHPDRGHTDDFIVDPVYPEQCGAREGDGDGDSDGDEVPQVE